MRICLRRKRSKRMMRRGVRRSAQHWLADWLRTLKMTMRRSTLTRRRMRHVLCQWAVVRLLRTRLQLRGSVK
jgi:hypothetical protein